jgi:hypothetical protein
MSSGIRKGIFTPMPFIGRVFPFYFGSLYRPSIIQNLPSMMLSNIWKKEFKELMSG